MELKNKKVLLVGLGILGGGLSVAQYLISKEAKLSVTDLRSKEDLSTTINKLPKDINYTLGSHQKSDFENADIILFNQAVPVTNEWVQLAKKMGKYYSDYGFFLENLKTINPGALIIGVTGTRGKTTISSWINDLIPGSVLAGNIPDKNFLKQIDKKTDIFVLEMSSYQLEHFTPETKAPNIAVLTNVYVDHLNRYKTLEKYKDVKFNIFKNQTEKDALILSADEGIATEALKLKPKSQIYYVSTKILPKNKNGMFFDGDEIYLQNSVGKTKITKKEGLAPHEKTNLLFSMLAAHLAGVEGAEIVKRTENLSNPKLRQELIYKDGNFEIYNDSAGTSPDATIAAIEKFKDRKNFVLITGGTDKELDSKDLAKKIVADVKPENLFLFEGSATDNLIKNITSRYRSNEVTVPCENLEDIVDVISQEYDDATIVFSPGAASFEKFKNEFDRGEQFNKLVKKYFSK